MSDRKRRDKSPSTNNRRHRSRERSRDKESKRERSRSRERVRSKERHRSRDRVRSRERRHDRRDDRQDDRKDDRQYKSRDSSTHKRDSYRDENTNEQREKSVKDVEPTKRDRSGDRRDRSRDMRDRRDRSRDRSKDRSGKRRRNDSRDIPRREQEDEQPTKQKESRSSKTPPLPLQTTQSIPQRASRFDSQNESHNFESFKESSKNPENEINNGRISRDEQSKLKVEMLKRQAGYDKPSTYISSNSKTEESRIDRISRQAQQKIKDEITQKHSSFKSQDTYEKVASKEDIEKAEAEEKKRVRRERLAIWKSQQAEVVEPVVEVIKADPILFQELQPADKPIKTKTATVFKNISQTLQSKAFAPRKSVFKMDQSEDEDEDKKRKVIFDDPTTVTLSNSTIKTKAEQDIEDNEIDPLDSYMNEVGDEVERLNDVIVVAEVKKKVVEFDVTLEEIMMPEDQRDPRDKKEVILDMDDPDAILAPVSSKFNIKKKDLISVDHSLIDYQPFRKDFWVEPPEFALMSKEENELRLLELDNIKIRGVDYPKPIQRWTQCGLTNVSYDILQKIMKLAKPTSIQAQAIPCIMSGRDVIGVAKTGSGKTLAFLLPLLRHVKDQPPVSSLEGPIALVMTPTRELALQIHRECKLFAKALNLKSVCVYGGAPIRDQIADLKRGAEIVICTPGRIIDLLSANNGRVTNLRRVTMLILDEADRMFDMGFEPQVMKILQNIRPEAQTVLFSATFPRQMEALARKVLKRPVEISVGGKSVVCQDVTQHVEVVHEDAKFVRLLEILGKALDEDHYTKILIFVDKHESADNMLKDLMRRGYPCQALHGGQDQADRDSTIQDFKQGHTSILIATSVAARGLDVKMLKIVVNYECPNHMEDYVHRVGRTGRAGNKGESFTFLTPDQDKFAIDIMKALKMSGTAIPPDVQKLGDKYLDKIKAGTVKALQGTGYGGKGLERLELERNSKKLIQKASHVTVDALEDAIDEEDKKANPSTDTGIKKDEEPEQNALMSMAKAVDVSAGMNAGGRFTLKATNGCVAYEIEVNGFPQQARFIITSKEILQEISQLTGAAVTVRGGYIPPNRVPKPNERRLYLYIEGTTKEMIDRAKNEIRRTLFQQTMTSMEEGQSSSIPFSSAGRYSVL